jgi:hypothetical protein
MNTFRLDCGSFVTKGMFDQSFSEGGCAKDANTLEGATSVATPRDLYSGADPVSRERERGGRGWGLFTLRLTVNFKNLFRF